VITEDEGLRRYGLHPSGAHLDEVRKLLTEQAALERRAQGDGNTELMKLCCVQLFHTGVLSDALATWKAKCASFDAGCSIDVQLLCGGGLEPTKAYDPGPVGRAGTPSEAGPQAEAGVRRRWRVLRRVPLCVKGGSGGERA
jgi:hypothetical protein